MRYAIKVTRLGGDHMTIDADDRQHAAEVAAKSFLLAMSTFPGLTMGDHSMDPTDDKMFFELFNEQQQMVMRLEAYPVIMH